MADKRIPRIMLAGTSSGSGKTLLTCALLASLCEEGRRPAAFKCGPDYIDPMFHRQVEGVTSRNLDLFLAGRDGVCRTLAAAGAAGESAADIVIIEGVMGLYDGTGLDGGERSGYEIAEATQTPVILIVDAQGMSRSAVAIVKGFQAEDRSGLIRGILLNRVSASIYPRMKKWIEEETDIPVVGGIPRNDLFRTESRHLGLRQPWETGEFRDKLPGIARIVREHADLEAICRIADASSSIEFPQQKAWVSALHQKKAGTSAGPDAAPADCIVAVARDEAFSFFYEDNLDLLREMGAEIVFFSPLHDQALPAADGMILGGGYPELYVSQLSQNTKMSASIRSAAAARMPILAECGGFAYLQESLTLRDGERFAMLGILPGHVTMTDRLVRFGYLTLKNASRGEYLLPGETIRAHEFHYSDSTENGEACLAVKPDGRSRTAIVCTDRIWAGYPHLYYPSNPHFTARFLEACRAYRECQ